MKEKKLNPKQIEQIAVALVIGVILIILTPFITDLIEEYQIPYKVSVKYDPEVRGSSCIVDNDSEKTKVAFLNEYGTFLSFDITNGNSNKMVINDIYFEILDWKSYKKISDCYSPQIGGVGEAIYYKTKIAKEKNNYTCELIDFHQSASKEKTWIEESASQEIASIYESIPASDMDRFLLNFSASDYGVYIARIVVKFNIENKEYTKSSNKIKFVVVPIAQFRKDSKDNMANYYGKTSLNKNAFTSIV